MSAAREICASSMFNGRAFGPADIERVAAVIQRHMDAAKLVAIEPDAGPEMFGGEF